MFGYGPYVWEIECIDDVRLETAEEDPKERSGSSLNRIGNDLDDVSLRLLARTFIKPIDDDHPFTDHFS